MFENRNSADELLKQIVEELHVLRQELNDFRAETKQHFDQHDKKLDAVYTQAAKNSEDISQIKADQHTLVVGQAKQDKILQMLATRSLEQESDIISLKRAK